MGDQMQGQQSLLSLEASISAQILDLLNEFSTAMSASMRDRRTASSAASLEAASSASTLDLLRALSVAMRSASISAATLDLLRAASVYSLDAASSAASLDLLNAFSVATLSAATSAQTLDLLRAASVATSASILDLLNATSVATLDAATSAAILERLMAFSVQTAETYLSGMMRTSSRGSKGSSTTLRFIQSTYSIINFIYTFIQHTPSTPTHLHFIPQKNIDSLFLQLGFGQFNDIIKSFIINVRVGMGNNTQTQQSGLTFVQILEDKHFGQVQIYRSSQGLFVMKICRTMIEGDKRHSQLITIMEMVKEEKISSIIPIIHYHCFEQKGVCIKYEKIDIYTEYYNFTLADLVVSTKELEQSELWFILVSLLNLIVTLKQYQITATLQPNNIFLTPAGMPCIYHYNLQSCKSSLTYSQFTVGQNIASIILQLALNIKLDECTQQELVKKQSLFVKLVSKYKVLGKCIKELITEGKTQEQMIESIKELQEQGLVQVATQVKLLKFKYCLPDNTQFHNLPLSKTNSTKEKDSKAANPKPNTRKSMIPAPLQRINTQQTQTKSKIVEPSSQANNLISTKDETNKILTDLDRKKQEYRQQKRKFEQRKEELLRAGKGKQNESLQRKSLKKKDGVNNSRKHTQNSIHQRYR